MLPLRTKDVRWVTQTSPASTTDNIVADAFAPHKRLSSAPPDKYVSDGRQIMLATAVAKCPQPQQVSVMPNLRSTAQRATLALPIQRVGQS